MSNYGIPNYGREEALTDLERMRTYGLNATYTTPDDEYGRMVAYITRIESQLTARECSDIHEVLATNERLIAERDEWKRVAEQAADALEAIRDMTADGATTSFAERVSICSIASHSCAAVEAVRRSDEYTHDDAMLDLRVLDGYALGVKGGEDSNEHVRLAAYITRIEAENERLRQNQCSKDWCDDALTEDLKALVRGLTSDGIEEVTAFGHRIGIVNVYVDDFRKLLTPRILEWAGVE